MTPIFRNVAALAVGFLLGACVGVGRIQQTEPIRTMSFTGSPRLVAQCLQQRLGGRVQDEAFGEKYIVYSSAKRQAEQGLTHWSITLAKTGVDQGIAEWRIVNAAEASGFDAGAASKPGGRRTPSGMTDATVERYWGAVEDCVARAKNM